MYHNAGQEVDHMPHKPQNKSKYVKFKQNAYLFQFQAAFCHVHVQESTPRQNSNATVTLV